MLLLARVQAIWKNADDPGPADGNKPGAGGDDDDEVEVDKRKLAGYERSKLRWGAAAAGRVCLRPYGGTASAVRIVPQKEVACMQTKAG